MPDHRSSPRISTCPRPRCALPPASTPSTFSRTKTLPLATGTGSAMAIARNRATADRAASSSTVDECRIRSAAPAPSSTIPIELSDNETRKAAWLPRRCRGRPHQAPKAPRSRPMQPATNRRAPGVASATAATAHASRAGKSSRKSRPGELFTGSGQQPGQGRAVPDQGHAGHAWIAQLQIAQPQRGEVSAGNGDGVSARPTGKTPTVPSQG